MTYSGLRLVWRKICHFKFMNIQLAGSREALQKLANFLSSNAELEGFKDQIINSLNTSLHEQQNDIPAEGDHPYIERSE